MVVEWRKGWGMKALGPLEWFQIHSQLDSSLLESTIDLSWIVFVSRMVNGNYSLLYHGIHHHPTIYCRIFFPSTLDLSFIIRGS